MAFADMDKTHCRTCFDPGKSFFTLSETVYETKSLLDLLKDIVHLQVPSDDPLPKTICCRCANRLKSAYDFIAQATDVNDKYMKLLTSDDDPLKKSDLLSDCLEESTIDIPLSQYIPDVKLEEGNADQFNVILGLKDQVSNDGGDQGEADDELDTLLTTHDASLKSDNSGGFLSGSELKDFLEVDDEDMENMDAHSASSSDESSYEPPKRKGKRKKFKATTNTKTGKKRRVGRKPPDYFDKIKKIKDRYGCFLCDKTFSLRKDCGRHIASIHLQQIKFTCEYCGQDFSRKDKVRHHVKRMHSDRPVYPKGKHRERVFGDRLYGRPKKWLLVECKICSKQYNSTKELRLHMETHTHKDTLSHFEMQSEIVKHLFPNAMSLECVKETIMKDIKEMQWFKYYTVLNEYSYEMSISDTEEEEIEAVTASTPKYKCDLCHLELSFQYEAYNHLKDKHENDEIPSKCGLCKLEFVSSKMYEHHAKVHCRNRNKVLLCTRCPAKFVWPENMRNHTCATTGEVKIEKEPMKCHICDRAYEVKTKLLKHIAKHEMGATMARMTIRCGLCEQTFERLSKLRKHILVHSDGTTGIDFKNSIYMKIFEKSKKLDIALLHQEIQNAFKTSQISRFYKAIDREGNELDILDSDSESDDDETQAQAHYKCELCSEIFNRRKLLMRHQHEQHRNVPLPFTCDDCMKQFVSNDLLQQHLYRDCWNEHRRVAQQCEYCNARFIWQSNLLKHKEIQHKNQLQTRPKRARTLKCEYCEKVFIWPKDLVRHRKTHTVGKQFACPHCDRKFQRKDNLLVHIRTHDPDVMYLVLNTNRMIGHVLPHLTKPHGCKRIRCMICHSEHNQIRDLRSHLRSHQYAIDFDKRKENESMTSISKQLYPEDNAMDEGELMKKIAADLCAENNLERFYSITNENGYEVNLDSSETETDSDDDDASVDQPKIDRSKRTYKCDACPNLTFNRKYKVYEHHRNVHKWEDAQHVCVHCNSRFLSSYMLQLHYKEQCKNAKKRHFCRRCPLRFMWKSNLKAHVTMDHAPDPTQDATANSRFDCFLCRRVFLSQKDLARHMSSIHSSESELHYCLLCPKTFYGVNHLNEHLSGHRLSVSDFHSVESIIHSTCWPNGDKSIKCMICTLEFQTMAELIQHFSLSNPQNLCSAQHSIANYSMTNQKGFELNIELDSETESEDTQEKSDKDDESRIGCKPYICSICNVSCERKYQMAQHQRSMHNYETLPLMCTHCVFRTVCQRIMDYHTTTQCHNSEKQFQCEYCKFKFMWQENLQNHIALVHQTITSDQSVESKTMELGGKRNEINIFECMECHRRYNRRDRYKAHFKRFHSNSPEAAEAIEKAKASAMKSKHFLCPFCGVNFSSNSNLTVHMRRHTGEKPFKCDLCDMAFPRSSDLQSHYRTHTGERPYKCEYCDKAFSRQYKLNVHVRVHTGERPYACTYCPKSFAQSNDLTLHVRRHTGERPYSCEVCGEGFICATSMNKHKNAKGHHTTSTKEERPTTQATQFELNF